MLAPGTGELLRSAVLPSSLLDIGEASDQRVVPLLLDGQSGTFSPETGDYISGREVPRGSFGRLTTGTSTPVAIAGRDNSFHWATPGQGAGVTTWHYPLQYAFDVQVPPKKHIAAVAFSDGKVRLWRTGEQEPYGTFGLPDRGAIIAVTAIAFSPDSGSLAIGYLDSSIEIWDVATPKRMGTYVGHSGAITAIVFMKDGQNFATASHDRTLKFWERSHPFQEYQTATMPVGPLEPDAAADGRTCAALYTHGPLKGFIIVSNFFSSEPGIRVPAEHARWKFLSPGGSNLVVGFPAGKLVTWRRSGDHFTVSATAKPHSGGIEKLIPSADATYVGSLGTDRTFCMLETAGLREMGRTSIESGPLPTTITLFADTMNFLAAFREKEPQLYDLRQSRLAQRFPEIAGRRVEDAVMAKNGELLIIGLDTGEIRLYQKFDTGPSREYRRFAGLTTWPIPITSLAVSHSGTRLAAGLDCGVVRLWDLRTFREIASLQGTPLPLAWVYFSGSPEELVGVTAATLQIWESDAGEPNF